MESVIDQVGAELSPGFPEEIAAAIFDGMRQARDKLSV